MGTVKKKEYKPKQKNEIKLLLFLKKIEEDADNGIKHIRK